MSGMVHIRKPPPVTLTATATVCGCCGLDLTEQWDSLPLVGYSLIAGCLLEMRNCACGSTSSKELWGPAGWIEDAIADLTIALNSTDESDLSEARDRVDRARRSIDQADMWLATLIDARRARRVSR